MVRPVLLLFVPLALGACSHHRNPHKLTVAAGHYRALNADQWTADSDDLRGPRAPLAPVDSPNAKQDPQP